MEEQILKKCIIVKCSILAMQDAKNVHCMYKH